MLINLFAITKKPEDSLVDYIRDSVVRLKPLLDWFLVN